MWLSHENLSYLWIGAITDSLGISIAQIDPESFFNSDVNTSSQSLRKNGDTLSDPATLYLSMKLVSLIIISGRGLLFISIGSLAGKGGRPTVVVGQLNFSNYSAQCASRRSWVNQCVVRFLNYLVYAWLPWACIPNQSVRIGTVSDSLSVSVSLNLPIHHHFLSFLRLLVSSRLVGLHVSL